MRYLIHNSTYLQYLCHLLHCLAAWENRPLIFSLLGNSWCSDVSKILEKLDQGKTALESQLSSNLQSPRHPRDEIAHKYAELLLKTLEVGFRQSEPYTLSSSHTPHQRWMFDIIFTSGNDEVLADTLCAWAADRDQATIGSCHARRLDGRVERSIPFSPRLRRIIIKVIQGCELTTDGSELDVARLLNQLYLDADDIQDHDNFQHLLVCVARSPAGREALSSQSWCLLGELALAERPGPFFQLLDVDVEVWRSVHDGEGWEKLEVWMLVIWLSFDLESEVRMGEIMQVTLRLFQQHPSALQRFELLCEQDKFVYGSQLRQICDQARAEQLSLPL